MRPPGVICLCAADLCGASISVCKGEEMPKKKKIRTRVTKKDIEGVRKKIKPKIDKKRTDPGPWTNTDPTCTVDVELKGSDSALGKICYGTYPKHGPIRKRGWYNILFNITSEKIKEDIGEYGLDDYMAACEKWFGKPENKKKYGTVVILEVRINNALRDDGPRFLSCLAKTNKKGIKGFAAIRQGLYQIIGDSDELQS